jgi:GDP-L-fucose synthase
VLHDEDVSQGGEVIAHLADKRIVVTGGSGFLGQHVVARLGEIGCRHVFVPRRPQFDLTQSADVSRLIRQQRPDVVLHLAWQSQAGSLYQNLVMGAHLIEACRRDSVGKFVQVGWRRGRENAAPRMLSALTEAYRHEHDFHGVTLVMDDLYGPGDDFGLESSSIIPCLIRACIEGRRHADRVVEVAGRQDRPQTLWPEPLYVRDAARAVELAASEEGAGTVHIATERMTNWTRLSTMIASKIGFQGEIRLTDLGHSQAQDEAITGKKLSEFHASTALTDGLDETIAWYENMTGRAHYTAAA